MGPSPVASSFKPTTPFLSLRGSIFPFSTQVRASLPPVANMDELTAFAMVSRLLTPLLSVFDSYIFLTLAYPSKLILTPFSH